MKLKKSFDWSKYIAKSSFIEPIFLFKSGYNTPKLILKNIGKSLKNEKLKTICELGCSAGYYGKLIEKSLGFKLYKVGVDNNSNVAEFNILNEYIIADLFKFKSKKKFDVVFSLGLIEHFDKEKRRKIFLKHLELSDNKIIIGFPNVDYSLTYFIIKIYNDLILGNRHYRIRRQEIIDLAKSENLKIIFDGYFGNNFFLQKIFRFKKSLRNTFFLDYYLAILEK